MKIPNQLLILILAFAIMPMLNNSAYSQIVTQGTSDANVLKVRLPQAGSNKINSINQGSGKGETDSPLGSISVNEDPYFNAMSPAQLVQQAFITGCLTASNVKFGYYRNINSVWTWQDHAWVSPANRQMGYFQKATSTFPIDEGIILTTGIASSAMGPNNTGGKSDLMVIGASDPDLSTISGEDMNDAAILEFDFVPAGNTMEFKYMFSSEEYLEYVHTSFNDAFGFFLSGPGITGPYQNNAVNIAVLPNGDPVTINTIHPAGINIADQPYPSHNEAYYLDNPQPSVTYQFDGGTIVLTATYAVVPCQTYHIKLSVADAFDQEFDGAVFLAAKSFNSENLILTNYGNLIEDQDNIFEGCSDFFRIERTDPDISKKLKLDLLLSGTATNGVDIQTTGGQPFPTNITIPENVSHIDIPYSSISDGIADNGETFIINIATSCPCAPTVVYVSKTIHIFEQVILNSISSTDVLCNNETNGTITVNTSGGSDNYEYSINNGTNWQSSHVFTGLAAGTYTVLVKDLGSCYTAISGTATIANPPAIIANAGSPVTICNGQNTQLNGSGGNLYSWSPSTGLSATNISNPIANPSITTTYTLTATNSIGQCPSTATVKVTVLPSPTAAISPSNPEICSGSSITLTASGGSTYLWNPGGATSPAITVSPGSNTSYTVTTTLANGCSDSETVNVVVKNAPALYNVTGGGSFCSGGSGVVVGLSGSQNGVSYQLKLNGSNLGVPKAGNGSALSFGNQNQAGTYTIEATMNTTACMIPMSGNAVITINPVPNAPSLSAITQPTCAVATGSIVLDGLPSGNWTINPGAITGNTLSTTLTGVAPGTYTYTVTNSFGCTSASSANIVVNAQPVTPSAPVLGTITQPTCAIATGSIVLNGLPAGNWTINPGSIAGTGSSKTISGLAPGSYSFTVTNSVGCTSLASANTVINIQPLTPSAPVVGTITQPTCAVATGSVTLSGLPTGNWTINPGAISGSGGSTTIPGLAAGTYSFTVTNAAGCTSPATSNVVFVAATPAAPILGTVTQPNCSVATGSVVLNGLPAGNWTINPGAISGSGTSTTISGITPGTYTFTVTNAGGCTSTPTASIVINPQPVTPSAPLVGTITQPTCTAATGSVILSGLPAGNWTINPGAITGNTASKTLSGLTPGTYSYTVTNSAGCTSPASASIIINPQPAIPIAPGIGAITQPTCSLATGSVVLTGLPAGNWTINPGAIAGNTTSTTISGLAAGTYTFTVTLGCTSAASANVIINPQPVTPSAPTIGTITQPTCAIATGSVVLNGLPSGTWTINPGAITGSGSSKTITGLTTGTYNYTVSSSAGCTSSSSTNVIINTQPVTPSAPIVGTITQPTCSVSTGSVVLSGLPAGNWTINPGSISGTGASTTISGLLAGTRTFTVTNSVGCASPSSASVVINTQPVTPAAPVVGVITQPTCSSATGSVVLNGLPSGSWIINPGAISGSGTSKTISGLVPGTYNYTVTNASGCTSAASANILINTHPGTPSAPVVGTITQPTCEIATGSVQLTGLPSGTWTINPGSITGSGSSIIIPGLLPGTHTFTVTNSAGCTSLATVNVVIVPNPGNPDAPQIVSITQPSCSVSTGSVVLGGLPTGTWTIYPGGITGTGPTTTISGLLPGTYNFSVTNGSGCISTVSVNVVINTQPETPATPILGTITQPTCAVSTGSVVLSGLPAGNWTINPGAISGTGASKTITSLVAGTYNFTVTNSVGCTSLPTANVVIVAATPPSPGVGTITQPTCSVSTGSVVLNNLPAGNWVINPGAISGSGSTYTRSGLVAGTYTYTVTNAMGCTSLPTPAIVINAQPVTPSAPVVGTITQPTCAVATGSVVLNGLPAGNWTINPGAITGTGSSKTISGINAGTYNFTVTNAAGCTSVASANVVINPQPVTPSAPTVNAIIQPTCEIATGSVTLSDLPAGTWTINPGAITGTGSGKTITGLVAGTYSYTVTNSVGCISLPSTGIVIVANPGTPAAPALGATTQPSCSVATGSVILNGLPSGNWTINPGAISGTGTSMSVTGLATGTYAFTVTNASGCVSLPSANVVINPQPVTPSAPTVGTITQPSCAVATGSVVLGGLPSGTWTINPGAITGTGSGKTISGLAAGTYNFTVTNSVGCTSSASANIVINTQPVTPSAPVVGTITQPTCSVSTGSVELTGLPAGNWVINPGAIAGTGSSKIISNIPAGTRTYTVTNSVGCTSLPSASVVINVQPVTPPAPSIGTITQPTCALATGSIVLTGLPTGSWTINPGGISGTGTSKTISGLSAGTYNYTVTNAVGCTSPTSANAVINAQPTTPSVPVVGAVTQPTCTVATGSLVLSGLPTGSWTINPGAITGSGDSKTLTGLSPGSYNFTVTNAAGCTSAATSAVVINSQPVTPAAPTVGALTQPSCSVSTGSIVLTGLPAGNWTINPGSIAGNTNSTTFTNLVAGTYSYTVTNSVGCTSAASANAIINAQPATPSAPVVGTVIQPTCTVATGSVLLSGLPSGTWTINPGAITGTGTSKTVTGLTPGTYNFTVTNVSGCTSNSSLDVIINTQPLTPAAPVPGAITQPTCSVATGNVVLEGLPAGDWTINPGSITGNTSSTNISSLGAGTYSYTVTNSVGCISAVSSNVIINPQPVTPSAPTISTIIHPTCTVATGSIILSGLPSGNWTLNPGSIAGTGTSKTLSGLSAGTYAFTVTNATGCTSLVSADAVINAQPATPSTPIIGSVMQPTCFVATGSVEITGLPSGNWTLNPGSISGSASNTILTGLTAGTYAYSVTNAAGCVSLPSANVVINSQPLTPEAPTVGITTQPSCDVATGSVELGDLPAGNWTINPGAITGSGASIIVSDLPSGTYAYSVTSSSGCTSLASANVVINTQPAIPSTPIIASVTQPTCFIATGTVVLSGLPNRNYTINPGAINGNTTSLTISGLTAGTYNFTVTKVGGCTSLPSATVVINPQPPTPPAPTLGTISQPLCAGSTGTISVSAPIWPGMTYSINGSDYTNATGVFSLLPPGAYTVTAKSADGCISPGTSVTIISPPADINFASPVVTDVTCIGANNGVIVINATGGTGTITYSIDPVVGIQNSSGTFSNLTAQSYLITALDQNGCTKSITITVGTVPDVIVPIISGCPSNIIQPNDAGQCSAVVSWIEPSATDNCTLSSGLVWTKSHTPGSVFPIGITTVTYTARDASNNVSAVCSFNVTIIDNQIPVISGCPSNITQPNDAGLCGAVLTWIEPTATDNCTPSANLVWTKSHTPGSTFPVGTTTVTYTAKDAANNISSICSFTVTVTDNASPTITCPLARLIEGCSVNAISSPAYSASTASSTYAIFSGIPNSGSASDNCGAITVSYIDAASGTCPINVTRTWIITDAAGNTSSCNQEITIDDNTLPVISCPATLEVNTNVLNTYVGPIGNATASDNCATVVSVSSNAPPAFPLGSTNVIWTATDNCGNTSTCIQVVTVSSLQIIANDDNGSNINGYTGGISFTNVLSNDLLNTLSVNPSEVTLTFVSSTNPGVTLSGANVVVAPGTAAGSYTLTYQICEVLNPTNCDQAVVTVTVSSASIIANDDIGTSVNGYAGGTSFTNVLGNDLLNGLAVNPSEVTLTFVSSTNPGVTLSGANVVVAPGTAAGSYTLTYQICEVLNPSNCDQAVVTVTVSSASIIANDDIGTSVNGYAGGTSFTNVLGNDLLNGLAVNPSEVTLTFVSSTNPGVTLSGANVVVAPGTAAGSYTLTYQICEVLNPTNCDQAVVTVTVSSASIIANDDIGTSVNGYAGGTSFTNVLGNDLLNGLAVNPSEVTLTFVSSTNPGVTLSGANVVVAPGTAAGSYTLTYQICEVLNPTNCDQAVVTVTVSSASIIANDDIGTSVNGYAGGTSFTNVLGNDLLNGLAVNPSEVTLTFVSSTNPGVTLSGANVVVAPGTAAGSYTLTYQICEVLNPTNCDQAVVTVTVSSASIIANDDIGTSVNGYAGGTSFTNVLGNDLLNGLAVNPSEVTLTFVSSTNPGVTLSGANVVVAPGTAAGSYTLTYQICEVLNPTNCDQAVVTVTVSSASIIANDDIGTSVNGYAGGTSFTNVLGNDLLNGLAVNPSEVTLTFVSSTNPGVTLSGANVVVAPGTSAGSYTLTYQICEVLNPINCDQAVVTVTVSSASIIANDDIGTSVNGYAGGTSFTNVLGNDLLNGLAVNPSEVTLTFVSSTNPGVTLSGANVVVAPGTSAGSYTLTYQICEVLNPINCDQAVVTVTVSSASIIANDDIGTSVNGYAGGTSFTNVLGNDLLNGLAVNPSEVTLTFVSSTNPGVTLSGANVVVAPGTSAGSYTLTYQICEVLNPINCDQAVVTVTVSSASIIANDDIGTSVNGYAGGTSFTNVLGNDLLNGLAVNPSEVTLTFVSSTNPGVTLSGANVVVAPGTSAGSYTLTYQICEVLNPINCDQAVVTVTVSSASIIANDDIGTSVNGYAGGTSFTNVLGNDLLNGLPVNPSEVTLTFVSSTNPGVTLSGANVVVAPGTAAGSYTLTYQICEVLNPSNCDQADVTVTVSSASIIANDDIGTSVNGYAGGTSFTNVLGNDLLNGLAVNPSEVTLSFVSSTNPGVTLSGANVVVAPGTAAGSYTLTYQICEVLNPTNCDQAVVTVTVSSASIIANDDIGTSVNGYTGGTSFTNVLGNDLLNGLAVNPSEVTLTFVSSTNPGVTLSGANVVVAPGTAAGSYTLTYQICEVLNPTNCDQAVVTVTVSSASIIANDDAGSSVNGYTGGTSFTNVLSNDLLNGLAVNPSEVTLTFVSSTNPGVTLSGANVVVAPGTAAGSYTLTYQICEVLNPTNCDQAVVTVTVSSASIIANDDIGTSVNGYAGGTSFTNVLGNDLLNGLAVNPSEVTLTFVSSTNPGVTLSGANVVVAPGTAAGSYTLTYQICEVLNPTNCDQAVVTVTVSSASIIANDDIGTSVNGYAGGTSFTNVLGNDLLNGLAVNPSEVTLTFVSSTNPGVTLSGANVVVAPGTAAGSYTLTYQICEVLNPTNCDQAVVTVTVSSASIIANDDIGTSVNGYAGGTSFTNVLGNDLLNGLAVNPSEVTLTFVSSTNPGVTLSGANVVVAPGTAAGSYTLTYQICEVLNPTNCDQAVVTVVVTDDEVPEIICPPNVTVNCINEIPLPFLTIAEFIAAGGSASDFNGINDNSFQMVSQSSDNNSCPETITRVYSVSDFSNNIGYCSHLIIIDDQIAPVLTVPANVTVECSEVPAVGTATATDNCDANVTVTYQGETRTDGTCADSYTLTRTWKASDNCLNETTLSQTITVQDVTAPVLTVPANVTVECSEVPAVGTATATDNCDANVTVTYQGETRADGTCADSYTLTRTWKASDNCLNETTLSQTITVQDVTAPVLTVPANVTVECSEVPAVGTATATDNCDANVTVTYQGETRADGTCADSYTLTRTWKASDNCLNETTLSQTITVQDVTAPVLTVPANVTVECSEVPAVGTATATDNCDANVTVTYQGETLTDGTCADSYTLTRTWKASDNCLNETTLSQTITVQDVTAPVLTVPANVTVECSEVPAVGTATATDNCDANVTVTYQGETRTDGTCADSYTLTRTWKASDNCLNETTLSQTITVQDVTAPVLTVPANVTVECSEVPAVGTATATDNCDANVTVTYQGETRTNGTCADSYTLTRTWKASDNCLNETSLSQIITVDDNTAPVIAALPAPTTIDCPAVPEFATATATDNCDNNPSITFEDVTTPGACAGSYSVTRTWTATDACGNSSTASQTIIVQDITAPVIAALPAPTTIDCPAVPEFATATATDACGSAFTLTFEDVTTPGTCAGSYSVTRTWTATDACGNASNASQTIAVQDITAPVVTCAADITVNNDPGSCGATVTVPQPAVVENCSSVTLVNSVNQTADASGFYPVGTTQVIWTVADECGNTTTCSMTVTVTDTEAPVITCPADILICSTEQPVLGNATATDNCGVAGITNNAPATFEPGTTLVAWTATDIHGNTSTCTQTVVITPQAVADAGQNELICAGQVLNVTTATAQNYSSLLWTTSGQGTILNASTLNPTYVPVNGETGNIYLTLTASGIVPCASVSDQMLLTILPAPIAIAGPDASICEGQSFTTTNAFAGYTGSILWTTNGSGTFTDPTLVVTTYIPGASDITAGSVILTITSAGTPPCGDASDNLTLTINKTTVAYAGNDDATCENLPYQITDATAQNYLSLAWTHTGQGTLTGANTLSPTYTPANGETGTITLTLTAEGIAPCGNAVDTKTLTIYAIPTAFAGADFESCDATPLVLASATATGATGVQWTSSGTGTFENASLVNATYTPSQSDVTNGSVTLTLTVTGNQPCGTASDQIVVTLIPAAHVFAGESTTICSNSPYQVNDATVSGAVSVSWTHDGQGVLENAGTLTPTYVPAAAESGFVHLFVMATGTMPCGSVTDSLTLNIIPAATVDAGSDIASCYHTG
jgi:large repetitive protein